MAKLKKKLTKEADLKRVRQLLQHFHSLNYTLAQVNDGRRLNLEPRQLLDLVYQANVVFPDEIEYRKQHGAP